MATNITSKLDRRSVLAGAAAMPALSLLAIAADPDPIFALIERHKVVEAAYVAACHAEDMLDEGKDDEWDELVAETRRATIAQLEILLVTTPQTVAGCAALLKYLDAFAADYTGVHPFGDWHCLGDHPDTLFSRLAGALERAS